VRCKAETASRKSSREGHFLSRPDQGTLVALLWHGRSLMKRYAFATAVIVIGLGPWQSTPRADQPIYNVEALGILTSIDNLVPAETGINASGEIVGTVSGANGQQAVRYTDGIGWEYVPHLTLGSTAAGVNASGDIVGTRLVGGLHHAYRYTASTGVVDDIAPLTGDAESFGSGINDAGDVVGQSVGGAARAFLSHVGLPAVQLPSLGGASPTNDNACGINNHGQIVETSADSTGATYAARVEADDQTILNAGTADGNPGMSSACPGGIDDLGHIGGFTTENSPTLGFSFHAYRWDPNDPVVADAGLPSTFGNVESIAAGVSAGWYMLSDGTTRALRHTDADGAVDLNTLLPPNSGWVLYQVKGINANGQMVGDGLFNGVPTVFRLTPPTTKDTTPPVIAAHDPVTVEATGPNGASVTYTAPSTTDNVDPNGTATCTPLSGSTFALGSTTVTCSAQDAAGNKAIATTFNVIVQDTTAPVIAAHLAVTAEATAPNGATVVYTPPGTSDLVDGAGTASCAPASGSTFALGTTPVICNANDAAGNKAIATTFSVVVRDTTPPVISYFYTLSDTIWPPNGKMVPVTFTALATDAVDPNPACALTKVSGSAGAATITGPLSANLQANNSAVYVVTVTCSDLAGNMSSASTTVTVEKTNGNANAPKANGKLALLLRLYDERDPRDVCRHEDRHRYEGGRGNEHRA
jgi:hypothetical protein